MTLITIRETAGINENPNATISFDHKGEYPITISNPLSPQEEERLEWYFERYIEFPFLEGVKFRQAQESITKYGQALFEQLMHDRKAYGRYSLARQEGVENLRFEIIGSPEFFHQMHWETLKDPDWPVPLVLDAPMVRTTFQPPIKEAESQVSPTINLLIVTARPEKKDVGYRTISKPLVESLRKAKIPVKIDILRPGTYEALSQHLNAVKDEHGQGYYHIIHFDLHGALATYQKLTQEAQAGSVLFQARYGRQDYQAYEGQKAFLFFESGRPGQADPAEAQEVADLLLKHSIPIAVLNACQSGKLTADIEANLGIRLMEAGLQMVVAMGYSVTVTAVAFMMTELYMQLFKGKKLSHAVCSARRALHDNKNREAYYDQTVELEDWMLPVVYQNGGALAEPAMRLREFTSVEEMEYWQKQARFYHAPEATYGFVGRDLDVLEIERRLMATSDGKRRNMLLIQGMGGAGKTTLFRHLMEWWQTTGFVEQVFYFGYDECAWNVDQIIDRLAEELMGDKLGIFRSLEGVAQRKMLGKKMRSERHLLVLDNMESITGSILAIKNALPPEERQKLRALLEELLGGETLVLLGSRGSEEWLAKGEGAPLRLNDTYHLPGLDVQAATTLAERVLERHVPDVKKKDTYRQSEAFQMLMELLDGYPLPTQVVLANLVDQTPSEVLKALNDGGIVHDSEIQDKTASLMLCIEYSYGNLEPGDQKLLMTLAPFTTVVSKPLIEKYIKYLRQQPALKELPFQRWPEILQQAQDWGLITNDQMKGYLRLQPVLPYFLRTRLKHMTEAWLDIETAYRVLYDDIADELILLMSSKKAEEKQSGQALARQEYENLHNALKIALNARGSIFKPYYALSKYLDSTKDQRRGLDLGRLVLAGLENYTSEALDERTSWEMAGVLEDIADHQVSLKRYEEGEASYQRALNLLEGLTDLAARPKALGKAGIYHRMGILAQEQRKWQQAEQYYQKAVKIKINSHDRYDQAATYLHLGIVAQEQRKWQQAEQYYLKALKIKIDYNNRYDKAATYHQLGTMAQEQSQWLQAEQYYQKAIKIEIEFNDRYSQANTYHQLGMMSREQRQWKQAEEYYQKALQIKIEFNDRYEQAGTYHNLGIVSQDQRQWKQAEEYYQKALQIKIEFNDRYEQAKTYHQLGVVAQEQSQWDIARGNLLKALEIFVKVGAENECKITLSSLASLWQANKDGQMLAAIEHILDITQEEAEKLLEK